MQRNGFVLDEFISLFTINLMNNSVRPDPKILLRNSATWRVANFLLILRSWGLSRFVLFHQLLGYWLLKGKRAEYVLEYKQVL